MISFLIETVLEVELLAARSLCVADRLSVDPRVERLIEEVQFGVVLVLQVGDAVTVTVPSLAVKLTACPFSEQVPLTE
jgi:hypothetical protein